MTVPTHKWRAKITYDSLPLSLLKCDLSMVLIERGELNTGEKEPPPNLRFYSFILPNFHSIRATENPYQPAFRLHYRAKR